MTFLSKTQCFTRINQSKVIFTFSFLFIFNLLGLTQNSSLCFVEGGENENFSNSSTHHLTPCEQQTPIDWYEGDYPDMTPVTIYVNFLFHPDALNWNNNANLTEQYYVDWSNEVLDEANFWLANMEQNQNVGPNGVQAPLVPDAKFRFKILTDENDPNDRGIYFQGHATNPIHGNNNSINISVEGENTTTFCFDRFRGSAPDIGTGAVGQQNGSVRLLDAICSLGDPIDPNLPHQGPRSLWARILNHEIGHNLNLQHSASCNNVCNTVDLSPAEECNSACPLIANCDAGINPGQSCPPANPGGQNTTTCTFNWGNNLMQQGNNKKAITPCQWSTVFNHIRDGNPNYFSWADNCTIIDNDLVIASNSNILWDRPKYLNRNVVVENGATLTIKCTVRMATGTKIIVKTGGRLIVDGGTVTKLCNDYWQGIEVWGNPNLAQTTQNQGYLILKNDATLEYANNAISLSNNGFGTTGGGLVRATGAHFINNKRSVEFIQYPQTNQSFFTSCDFELTSSYNLTGFLQHVSMWNVRNVRFSGCNFLNNSTIADRGEGIYSLDAQYLVQNSTFDGFLYGIYGFNEKSVNTFSVITSHFTDNSIGVYAGAVPNIQVKNNIFEVGLRPFFKDSALDQLNHGVFVEGGTGYHVEDNDFFGVGMANKRTGVLIKNTGDESNMVFRNDFFGLDYANLSNGDNRNNNNPFLGLQYICNENLDNTLFDFALPTENQSAGICENQGSSSEAAANTFSYTLGTTASDFNNRSFWTIKYWYNPLGVSETPQDVYNVLPEQTRQNECTNIDRTDKPKEDAEIAKERYENTRENYNDKIDGGNTTELRTVIGSYEAQGSILLFQQLETLSPYLSTTILATLTDRTDLITNEQLLLLLIENPDALRTNLRDYISNKRNSIPALVLESAFAHRYDRTERTDLEEQMSFQSLRLHDAVNRVLQELLAEEVLDFEEIRLWLGNKDTDRANYDIVETYLQEGLTSAALAQIDQIGIRLANDIANSQPLNFYDDTEHIFYKTLKEVQIALINSGRTDNEMSEAEIASVLHMAENSQDLAGIQARNWLNADYGYDFMPVTVYPTEGLFNNPLAPSSNLAARANTPELGIYAYPNPAKKQVNFQFRGTDKEVTTSIQITDINGRLVEQIHIPKGLSQIAWDIPVSLSGVYLYRFIVDDRIQETHKLIIIQ